MGREAASVLQERVMDDASVFRNRKESVPGGGSRGNLCVLLVPLVEAAALDQRLESQSQELGSQRWKRKCGAPALRPGAVAQSPGREAALAWASLAQRFPASSLFAREGAGCGS